MKVTIILTILGLMIMLCSMHVLADCDENKNSDDGEVKSFFKNLNCKIQKGVEDLSETAKPWADKIGSSAKDFGHSVAQKYDEIKHKLTDDNESGGSSMTSKPYIDAPTEKVPLAPLQGEVNAADKPAGATAA